MGATRWLYFQRVGVMVFAVCIAASQSRLRAQQVTAGAIRIDNDDIGA
ncbi:MAG: hypothetical protein ACJ788_15970 [Ktedonobacteraceae bacterium]